MDQDRTQPRREACQDCPTYAGHDSWRCPDHTWFLRFGKWWISLTGGVIVLLFPVICALLWFIAQLNSNLNVVTNQMIDVKLHQASIFERLEKLENGRQKSLFR